MMIREFMPGFLKKVCSNGGMVTDTGLEHSTGSTETQAISDIFCWLLTWDNNNFGSTPNDWAAVCHSWWVSQNNGKNCLIISVKECAKVLHAVQILAELDGNGRTAYITLDASATWKRNQGGKNGC